MPKATTWDIDVASWWWQSGLQFVQCMAVASHGEYTFLDPDARAADLEREFRRQSRLREFLHGRRRLGFSLRVARVSEDGVATREDIDRPRRRVLYPRLRAEAQRTARL